MPRVLYGYGLQSVSGCLPRGARPWVGFQALIERAPKLSVAPAATGIAGTPTAALRAVSGRHGEGINVAGAGASPSSFSLFAHGTCAKGFVTTLWFGLRPGNPDC